MHACSRWIQLPLLAVLAGCKPVPSPPVPVAGASATLSRLAGEWAGQYRSPDTGRSGSILFTMIAGENHAHGDVEMIPRGTNMPLRPFPPQGIDPSRLPQILTIDFVRASGDSVTGTLMPYLDPECRCAASTSFAGRLEGDVISGTFRTYRADGGTAAGTWEIRRRS